MGKGFGLALLCGLFGAQNAFALDNVPPADGAPSTKEPRVTALDFSLLGGGLVRLGDAPLLNLNTRVGGVIGLGLGYVTDPIALSVSYEHSSFGVESTGASMYGAARVTRALDTAWAQVRVRLSGVQPVVPFLGVGLGASFQTGDVRGVFLPVGSSAGGSTFGCSARDSVNLGLRAVLGAEVPLSPSWVFSGEGSFDAYRLSDEVIDSCLPGAGAANAFGLRIGLVYRFDMSEAKGHALPPSESPHVR